MKFKSFVWIVGTVLNIQGALAAPDEAPQDHPWASYARKMKGETPVATLPAEVLTQLRSDARCGEELSSLWGSSLNFDEHARAEIVAPSIVAVLHHELNLPLPPAPQVHAGITHTYGYLFSLLQTPFGFKRDRWVSGKSEVALGLPARAFHPDRSGQRGTLLANVTLALGRVALWDSPAAEKRLKVATCSSSPELMEWKPQGRWTRISETASTSSGRWEIRTDLTEKYLVYSVRGPQDSKGARLITGFPIEPAFSKRLIDEAGTRAQEATPIVLPRYNAFIPDWPSTGVPGKVQVSSKDFKP